MVGWQSFPGREYYWKEKREESRIVQSEQWQTQGMNVVVLSRIAAWMLRLVQEFANVARKASVNCCSYLQVTCSLMEEPCCFVKAA